MNFSHYLEQSETWIFSTGLRLGLIIVLTIVAFPIARFCVNRALRSYTKKSRSAEVTKRVDTLTSLLSNTSNILILAVACLMALKELGIEIGPILAAAGVVGLAVGFGAQNLVQDIISGFFIFLEDQVRVGDVVEVAGKSGLVEKVTLRMVILRDASGNVHFVRNGEINIVTNMTKDFSRYVFNIGVAYDSDIDHVIRVIKAVDEDLRNNSELTDDILEPIEVLGLDSFGDSALIIKARTKTKPIRQWAVAREFNRRLKMAFDKENIEIPFPYRTLCFKEPLNILQKPSS